MTKSAFIYFKVEEAKEISQPLLLIQTRQVYYYLTWIFEHLRNKRPSFLNQLKVWAIFLTKWLWIENSSLIFHHVGDSITCPVQTLREQPGNGDIWLAWSIKDLIGQIYQIKRFIQKNLVKQEAHLEDIEIPADFTESKFSAPSSLKTGIFMSHIRKK